MNNKIFGDNIHGPIEIHPLLVKIIDTPQFQRLRHIKQLGAVSFVYPTANHTRFEHCIGTSYICDLFMKHLKENQSELNITPQDELCVRIAGLCHDLGRGPFSHIFDVFINKRSPTFTPKEASVLLFDKMLNETENLKEDFKSYGLFENDLQLIKDLIYNKEFDSNKTYENKLYSLKSLKNRKNKSFLFEIVSNNRNGIDAIKFDYFERDSKNLGFSNNFDFKRYIKGSRVIYYENDFTQICCRDKIFPDLYEMYQVRERLTKKAYKHKTCLSINAMIVEALELATYYGSERLEDINIYQTLNDSIYHEILQKVFTQEQLVLTNQLTSEQRLEVLKSQKIAQAKKILERIEKRKLYKFIGFCVVPDNFSFINDSHEKEIKFYVEHLKFNWGLNSINPLENVKCYNKYKPNEMKQIKGDDVSTTLQKKFHEEILYFYIKKEDYNTEYLNSAKVKVENYCQDNSLNLMQGLEGF